MTLVSVSLRTNIMATAAAASRGLMQSVPTQLVKPMLPEMSTASSSFLAVGAMLAKLSSNAESRAAVSCGGGLPCFLASMRLAMSTRSGWMRPALSCCWSVSLHAPRC